MSGTVIFLLGAVLGAASMIAVKGFVHEIRIWRHSRRSGS